MSHGLAWYWHRLRAMKPAEVRERLIHRLRQRADASHPPDFRSGPGCAAEPGAWPVLPAPDAAPPDLVRSVAYDAGEILAGRWRGFGHLLLQVGDPPKWFTDYAAGRELPTARPGFRLNHRALPRGADIKVVWELSRWHAMVRLAQAAWLEGDTVAGGKCVAWLDDWRRQNPPYIGWNWTSALEAGIRLVNVAWMDALLGAAGQGGPAWERILHRVVPEHLWFVSRHRSFGSSANNHLLGELTGLIVAGSRWPAWAARWGVGLEALQRDWEREVLAQFAPDGGNREQALNYQLFSWELAWQARAALRAAGRTIDPAVEERLQRAADFFVTVQVPGEPWDYGDSDSATVTPLVADETRAVAEWYAWLAEPESSPALRFWLGEPPPPVASPACVPAGGDWLVFPESGQAVCWTGAWQVRWDLSPLGYLSTAAHGHLDALHVSLWLGGAAVVIDPGTGAYYGDVRLRSWLASWAAHNGPVPVGQAFPRRLGPFLWGEHHARPSWRVIDETELAGELALPGGTMRRHLRRLDRDGRDGWEVDDLWEPAAGGADGAFEVRWQFAPGTRLEPVEGNPRFFQGERRGMRFTAGFDAAWTRLAFYPETTGSLGFPVDGDLAGLVSPAFRRIEAGPAIVLSARGGNPAKYRSTFLAG